MEVCHLQRWSEKKQSRRPKRDKLQAIIPISTRERDQLVDMTPVGNPRRGGGLSHPLAFYSVGNDELLYCRMTTQPISIVMQLGLQHGQPNIQGLLAIHHLRPKHQVW